MDHQVAVRSPGPTCESGIFDHIICEIQVKPFGRPRIILRRITALTPVCLDSQAEVQWQVKYREVTYSFPGRNTDEAWRFSCVGRILHEIYNAVRSDTVVTKRDIYYRDPDLFKRQTTVDRYIDDIAYTLQVTRADLHVTASPKGLLAGLDMGFNEHFEHVQLIQDPLRELKATSLQGIKWIVVVEKEASFRALVENAFHCNRIVGQGLLVTGKGYPDLATRRLLRMVLDHNCWAGMPPPIYGLFDSDPDGINILKTFQSGSKRLAQEHAANVPEMVWLGLKLEDEFENQEDDGPVLRLTPRDRAKARTMLASDELGPRCTVTRNHSSRIALQQMLLLNCKMEIQILEERSGGMCGWLERKLITSMRE